jgi:uncharacterized membrane protein YhaH (DUF805 family)
MADGLHGAADCAQCAAYACAMRASHRLVLLLGLAALVALAWWPQPDAAARAYVQDGLKRSLATYATARALDAVISAAQGTEASAELVVGVTFAPGQLLDPVNDLIEQFSSLMLAASVAFGAQRLLIEVGAYWAVSLVLTVLALAWAACRWRDRDVPGWLSRLLLVAVFVRFAMPVVAFASEQGYRLFMADEYAAAQATIEQSVGQFTSLAPPTHEPLRSGESWVDRVRRWWSNAAEGGQRLEQMKQAAERVVDQVIRLIVVFMMQTLVLPLLFLWLLLQGLRGLVSR